MQTYSSTNYNVRDKISNYQKSRIENQNIDKNKLIRDVPLKYNNKHLLLTKICSFIQKIRCRFKYRSISKNNLDIKSSMNVLISLYGNIDEHKISEKISLTETMDVGKMMDFDTLQESLIDIDMIFNNLISKIDQSMSSLQTEKPDSNLDDSLEPFDLEHDHNTLSTITPIDNYLPQLSGNKITIFSDHDLDFDQQLISDFSVLSKLITIILPPSRSRKRLITKDNENAKKFYYEKI